MKNFETFSGTEINDIVTESGPAPKESVFFGLSICAIWSIANEIELDTTVVYPVLTEFDLLEGEEGY